MAFEIQQYRKRAASYERLAEQESAPLAIRMLFARKANSLRIIARLAALEEGKHWNGDSVTTRGGIT